jgi:type IV secretion system protein TrbJ
MRRGRWSKQGARAALTLKIALALALVLRPAEVCAGTMTGGATEWTQIANNIQLAIQLQQQIMMQANMVKQLIEMRKMTKKEDRMAAAAQIFGSFQQIMMSNAAIAFAGVSTAVQWRKTHPGAQTPQVAGYGTLDEAYVALDQGMHDAADKALQALDVQADATTQDQQILQQLQQRAGSASGQMQATQASNEILLELVRQMNLLRQLVGIQARMETIGVSEEAQRRLYKGASRNQPGAYTGKYRGAL